MRGGSYSYSPSPPRGYGRRHCSPSSRGRYEGRGRDLPTSLLVRNLRHDCRFVLSPLFDWCKNALLKTLSSNKYCWKEVGFEFIVKKCKSGRISTQLTFGSQGNHILLDLSSIYILLMQNVIWMVSSSWPRTYCCIC